MPAAFSLSRGMRYLNITYHRAQRWSRLQHATAATNARAGVSARAYPRLARRKQRSTRPPPPLCKHGCAADRETGTERAPRPPPRSSAPPDMGVEVAVVQRQASPAGEHEVVSRSAINSLLEQRGHGRGDRDGPSRSRCLWMPEVVIPHRVFRLQLPGEPTRDLGPVTTPVFKALCTLSQRSNQKQRDVAAAIVQSTCSPL